MICDKPNISNCESRLYCVGGTPSSMPVVLDVAGDVAQMRGLFPFSLGRLGHVGVFTPQIQTATRLLNATQSSSKVMIHSSIEASAATTNLNSTPRDWWWNLLVGQQLRGSNVEDIPRLHDENRGKLLYFYLQKRKKILFRVEPLCKAVRVVFGGTATRLPGRQDRNGKLCLHGQRVGGLHVLVTRASKSNLF